MDWMEKILPPKINIAFRKAYVYTFIVALLALGLKVLFWPTPAFNNGVFNDLWNEGDMHFSWIIANLATIFCLLVKGAGGICIFVYAVKWYLSERKDGPDYATNLYAKRQREEYWKEYWKEDEIKERQRSAILTGENKRIRDEEQQMRNERRHLEDQLTIARAEGIRQAEHVKWTREQEMLRKQLTTAVEDSKRRHLIPPPKPAFVPAPPLPPPSPPVSRHLTEKQIEELALKAVHRIADLPPRERAVAWEKWRTDVTRDYPELIAQEVKQRAATLAGPAG